LHAPARPRPVRGTVDVPMGYCEFPTEILRRPRSLAARAYTDIRRCAICRVAEPFDYAWR